MASLSREKASELRNQVAAIVAASGLAGQVAIRRSPYPGRIESTTGTLETLSADRTAGHASSFDLVLCDETGLLPERARELLAVFGVGEGRARAAYLRPGRLAVVPRSVGEPGDDGARLPGAGRVRAR